MLRQWKCNVDAQSKRTLIPEKNSHVIPDKFWPANLWCKLVTTCGFDFRIRVSRHNCGLVSGPSTCSQVTRPHNLIGTGPWGGGERKTEGGGVPSSTQALVILRGIPVPRELYAQMGFTHWRKMNANGFCDICAAQYKKYIEFPKSMIKAMSPLRSHSVNVTMP